MINNELRIGNFTSSQIVALSTPGKRDMTTEELAARPKSGKGSSAKLIIDYSVLGKKATTYIKEKNMERRLERSLTTESNARPLAWGLMLESFVFSILGLDYKPCSKSTVVHPEIEYWSGSPDAEKFEDVNIAVDIKCPITLKSFCTMVDSFAKGGMNAVRAEHPDGEKYYWQIVSNAILLGAKKGELLVYCPYKDELDDIREMANNYDGEGVHRFFFITVASDDELPNIKRDGHYKNINRLTFDIPEEDIELLTKQVEAAGKHLIKRK